MSNKTKVQDFGVLVNQVPQHENPVVAQILQKYSKQVEDMEKATEYRTLAVKAAADLRSLKADIRKAYDRQYFLKKEIRSAEQVLRDSVLEDPKYRSLSVWNKEHGLAEEFKAETESLIVMALNGKVGPQISELQAIVESLPNLLAAGAEAERTMIDAEAKANEIVNTGRISTGKEVVE